MARALKGWTRPRPIRIAFLIEDGEHSAAILDAVFADCYGRWGGRFSLLVPCVSGNISPAYWRWLDAYDPDLIYSYVPLDRAGVLNLHERLSPAKYVLHRIYRDRLDDPLTYRPNYDFKALSSLSTIFRSARYTRVRGEGAPVQIIDSWFTERPTRFLTDNFGTYHSSQGGGVFPSDAMGAASILTIVASETRADPTRVVPRDLNAIENEMAAFAAFASGRTTSLSMASQLFAPKLDVDSGRWGSAFNLVVGETFADRVMFWNARLLIPSWLDNNLCCFRITRERVEDGDFLQTLVGLIKEHNHVNAGAGGQPQLTVRSCSLDMAQLEDIQTKIAAQRLWTAVQREVVADLDAIVPTQEAFSRAQESSRFGPGFLPRANWAEFVWKMPTARPSTIAPDHLVDAPPRQVFVGGYWATDFLLEYDGPVSRLGDGNRWLLPRRWRMAGAFQVGLTDAPSHERPPLCRRSRPGALTTFNNADHAIDTITVPTAFEAFHYALVQDGQWSVGAEGQGTIEPPSKMFWIEPSNEARYFAGVLGMAGGLELAVEFLLHPFLSKVFASLGGTPALEANRVTPTVNRLEKLAPRIPAFDLRADGERKALATLIVKAAQTLKNPLIFVRYEELKAAWKQHLATYWAERPRQGHVDSSDGLARLLEEQSLDACLISMRRRQILFQGHHWTCSNCHHRNWVDMGGLASELVCEICKRTVQTPVVIDWLFRPNEFLIESLRDHSVLSLVWALRILRDRSRTSFIYSAPTWFTFGPDSQAPEAEADLLVLSDGRAILCEVKSSWRSLRISDIRALVELSKRLRPDITLLAVMETGAEHQAELAAARTELEADGIVLELLTPNGDEHLNRPFLPAVDE